MLDQLLNFTSSQKLFHPGQKVLLAVSGGIDSMVLAHLFSRTQFPFAIAHCNFQLRDKESDEDQILVESMAKKYHVSCYSKSFATDENAKTHGISIQMSARFLRRAWFETLLVEEGFDLIATAHHLNDSLETVIFNLTKGTGISGLKGILPKKENYIRPLMFASRDMILEYAQQNNIVWREDRSNSSLKYHRNFIRHMIVPKLKKINPGLETTISQTLEKISAAERIYKNAMATREAELVEPGNEGFRIAKEKLDKVEEPLMVLFEILEKYGFNFQQVKDILKVTNRHPGKTFITPTHQLIVDREFLFIQKAEKHKPFELLVYKDSKFAETPFGQLTFEQKDPKNVNFSDDNTSVFIDYDKLSFPLKIRTWQHGDRFQPLGMQHKKKLSDFMIDEKIPLNLKEQVLVLCSGENLVWVIGLRIDDRYKITKNTTKVFSICNINSDDQSV